MATRDIVQFVAMRNYEDLSKNSSAIGIDLAKELLAEIPDQVTSYFFNHKIVPLPT